MYIPYSTESMQEIRVARVNCGMVDIPEAIGGV
jgi:hypothetical protein